MRKAWFGVWVSLTVAACATIPQDRGYGDVRRQTAARGVELPEMRIGAVGSEAASQAVDAERAALVADLVAQPLTADGAVRLAFVQSPRMRAAYAALGLSGAEVVRAGRLTNPTLAATWQTSSRSADADRWDLGLTQNFAEALMLGARRRLANGEFERAKLDATRQLVDFAADVREAYYDAIGAQHVAQMRETVANVADASAVLTARFKDAGNVAALELAVAQAAASQAMLDRDAALADVARTRSALNELLGFAANAATWTLDGALPMPVAEEDSLDALQARADRMRADLASDRQAVALLEDALGVTRSYRYVGAVEVGVQYERDTDRAKLVGPSLALQLPLFNQGQSAVLQAQAQLETARARADSKALEVSNGVRAANDRVMAMRARVERLRDETIPLRERIVARTQQQVDAMLLDVFDLLRVKQDEYASYQQYIEALRDYWRARVELARAVGARLPSDPATLPQHHAHGDRP